MTPSKLAVIVVLTCEMIEAGDAETIMSQVLQENVGASLDLAFLQQHAAVAGISPAGILNGAISVGAAGRLGSPGDTATEDLANLAQALGAVSGNSKPVLICAPAQASVIASTIIDPPPVYVSNGLAAGTVVAVVPAAIASADGTPDVIASVETHLHMSTPAAELVGTPGTVAAPASSIFQSGRLALRFTMDLSWTKRGAWRWPSAPLM
jgi:hypothetical protein